MVAVDTNVLVRLLTRDDPPQALRADALFRSEEVWIAKTVLLETEWVLRSLYGFEAEPVLDVLRALAALPNVHLEDPAVVVQAFEGRAHGFDFSDALHLASRGMAQSFVTFDKDLVRQARRAGATGVASL
jgi:predicted nucleic-acid-binding protein